MWQATKATAEASKVTADTLYKQQRAYVWPGPGNSAKDDKGNLAIQITVHNVGQTAAILKTVAWGYCQKSDWTWPPVAPIFEQFEPIEPELPLEPGRTENRQVKYARALVPLEPPKVFYIRITYLDVFGTTHYWQCAHDILPTGGTQAIKGAYSAMWD